MSSTRQPEDRERGAVADASVDPIDQAVELVRAADGLVAEVLHPHRWPRRATVDRFLEGDRLERVLGLYSRAMRLDPDEPAYPWNLAGVLSRLGLDSLALSFVERAIRTAVETGDEEWSDAGAHVAWAEIAMRAGQDDVALIALARARRLASPASPVSVTIAELLGEVARRTHRAQPAADLARELMAMTA